MSKLAVFKEITVSLAVAFLTLINMMFWGRAGMGWLILLFFLWYFGNGAHKFLRKYFSLSGAWRIFILSMFLVLMVLGSISGVLALIYKMSPLSLSIGFLITGLIFSYLKLISADTEEKIDEINDEHKQVLEQVPGAKNGILLYFILIVSGFYFLKLNQSGDALISPWQVISTHYIWIFFAATMVLGFLIFARVKANTLLFLLILHSFLLHAYLPLSQSMFFGADGWRHLALENSWWDKGVIVAPNLSGASLNSWQKLDFGTFAYAQFNALSLIFQKLCLVRPITWFRDFLPFLWPAIFAILVFEIARSIGGDKRQALWVVYLTAWPYALQVSGSFNLPVNVGFLFWLLAILLFIKNSEKFSETALEFLIFIGVLFIFGHSLFLLLFWLAWALLFIIKKYHSAVVVGVITLLTALFLPVIELISGFSQWPQNINWWSQLKMLAGSLSGYYSAFGLRTNNINVGNIFFNQGANEALVINWFTTWRGYFIVVMVVFWIISLLSWIKNYKSQSYLNIFWIVLSVSLLGGYIISRYFLRGENIFNRRLDATLAILLLLPVANYLYNLIKNNFNFSRLAIFVTVMIFSLATIGSYTTAPDSRAMSWAEYSALSYIWSREKNQPSVCVLADTYPLLALEEISHRRIVGGGFPIDSFFGQKERVQLLKLAATNIKEAMDRSRQLVGTPYCYLVGDYNFPKIDIQFQNIKVYKF